MYEKSGAMTQQAINQVLEERGIMPTAQRLQIAEVLFSKTQHLSADQLMEQLNTNRLRVSKATLYNTLNLLADKGLINPVVIDPNRVIYDTNTEKHFHFYNQSTGELVDINESNLTIDGIPELPSGTQLVNMDVIIRIRRNRAES